MDSTYERQTHADDVPLGRPRSSPTYRMMNIRSVGENHL